MWMMLYLLSLLLAMGVCAHIAEGNGRNKLYAIVWGFLFGWFAVAGYLIYGKDNSKK